MKYYSGDVLIFGFWLRESNPCGPVRTTTISRLDYSVIWSDDRVMQSDNSCSPNWAARVWFLEAKFSEIKISPDFITLRSGCDQLVWRFGHWMRELWTAYLHRAHTHRGQMRAFPRAHTLHTARRATRPSFEAADWNVSIGWVREGCWHSHRRGESDCTHCKYSVLV